MSKLKAALTFMAGAALGAVTSWYFVKEWYANLADEEIASVKKSFAQKEEAERQHREQTETKTPVVTTKVAEKGNITDYAKRVQNGAPMEYSKTVVPEKADPVPEISNIDNLRMVPYVIPPEEFDEVEGYTPVSLTYFADGVLADELGVIVEDVEEVVGDGLEHFGEYEDDSVFVRNDVKHCDYEILRDDREYEEFRRNMPKNI